MVQQIVSTIAAVEKEQTIMDNNITPSTSLTNAAATLP